MTEPRSVWRVAAIGLVLSGVFCRASTGQELKDLIGYWEGKADGNVFPEPIDVMIGLWMEEDKVRGIQGSSYGVSTLDGVRFEEGKLTVTFYNWSLGPGIMEGEIVEGRIFKFRWQVADGRGTGELRKFDPEGIEPVEESELTGIWRGHAEGPMLAEAFDFRVFLSAKQGRLTGRIEAPDTNFQIIDGVYSQRRMWLLCRDSEDRKALIIGRITEKGIECFWSAGDESGSARLTKQ